MNEKQHGITGVRALLRLLTRFLYAKNLVAAMQLDSVHGDGSRAKAGDPSGRPKHDLAAEIAKACIENNADALYKAFSKALLKGNAYAFKELSDRAYGRLKEKKLQLTSVPIATCRTRTSRRVLRSWHGN